MNSLPDDVARIDGDTPTMRLLDLLEVIAARSEVFSLQTLVEETGVPKPTLHRMLQQLESAGMLQREGDGRHYSTGVRLLRQRRAQRWLNSCRLAVMRVPPDQSCTAFTTCATATSGSRLFSSRVVRVSRVPNTKLSTRASA